MPRLGTNCRVISYIVIVVYVTGQESSLVLLTVFLSYSGTLYRIFEHDIDIAERFCIYLIQFSTI